MSTTNPWGNPKPERPSLRVSPIILVVLVVLPIAGYFVGRSLEQHVQNDPKTRLEVAVKALQAGYDVTALKLFQPLAAKGDAKAQYHLAIMYEHGWGTPVDNNKALELYTKAAQQSLVPAEAHLGEIYLHGTMVLQDLGKAREWFEKAAQARSSDAQMQLAEIYERGLGVPADRKEAYAWNAIAAKHGNVLAASLRDKILATLSPDAQAQAEARAKALEASLAPPSSS
jgi:TPR repeat protein